MTTFTGKRSTYDHGTRSVYGLDEFEFRACGTCGVTWAIPYAFMELRRQDGETWYCPNGHPWVYSGETEARRLKRENKELQERLEASRDRAARITAEADQARASLAATRGVVTKQKRKLARVANGVCPCCNRSFVNLERHMSKQHPEFG